MEAQKNKIYQALDRQIILGILFIVGLGLSMGFVDNKKTIKYHQTYSQMER